MGEGTVSITSEGKVSFELGNGVYCAEKEEDNSKITVTKKKCGELIINTPANLEITYTSKKAGEVTVVGKVSNKPAEIESYEFSIDNGVTWVKGESNTYTFKGLEIGKKYNVLMRVTNKNKETVKIDKAKEVESILLSNPNVTITPTGDNWATSKTVSIESDIDTNIYKIVYSLDGTNYQDYINPVIFNQNGSMIVDIVRKDNKESVLKTKQTINITKIDSTIPTEVNFTYENKTEGLVITATAIDEESGIYGYQFSIDNGITFTNIQTSNEYIFKNLVSGNTYNLKVKAINNTYLANGLQDSNSLISQMQEFKFTNFKVRDISYGLAIDTSNNLWSWGSNGAGQLGDGTKDSNLHVLTKISFNGTPKKICSSDSNSKYVIDTDGNLWSWGDNTYGQLGTGGTSNVLIPTKLNLNFKVSEIACSSKSALAIDTEGNLYAWGDNSYNNLGTSNKFSTLLASGTKFKYIYTSTDEHVAISADGEIYRWGREATSNISSSIVNRIPTKVFTNNSDIKFVKVLVAGSHLIALDENGHLWVQGKNGDGQLGNGTTEFSSSLISILPAKTFIDIGVESYASYALDSDGNVWSWGNNSNCNLGYPKNNLSQSLIPIKVNISSKIRSIINTYAIDENNNSWFWGYNYGYSGDGTKNDICSPIKMG